MYFLQTNTMNAPFKYLMWKYSELSVNILFLNLL